MSQQFRITVAHAEGLAFATTVLEELQQTIVVDGEARADAQEIVAEGYGSGDVEGRLNAFFAQLASRLQHGDLAISCEIEGGGGTYFEVARPPSGSAA